MTSMAHSNDPIPNLPLLRKILDHIDANPEEWDQAYFVNDCGTAFCIAGHAVAMTEGVIKGDGYVIPASGRDWGLAACEALGISLSDWYDQDDDHLFSETNTRADVQRHAERIAARAGEVL